MKSAKFFALCLAALSTPFLTAHACGGGNSELSIEGEIQGDQPLKITTPGGPREPARTWIDDDGLPTIMSILQAAEGKKDISAYGDLFKKSLARLSEKAKSYKDESSEAESKAHYKAIEEGAKKFLDSNKDKPLDDKMVEAFYKEMKDPLYGAIVDGVFGYQLIDPKTGKVADSEQPFASIGEFGPAVKFTHKVDGIVTKGGGCGTYSIKIKQPAKKANNKNGDTYMVNPGQ